MSGAAFLRVKKLKGGGIITKAARHNRRVIQAELGAAGSIDPARSCLNETLQGPTTADGVALLAKNLMTAAGVGKLRKDAVMAIEFVFSLPPGQQRDDKAYFTDCAAWTGASFGGAANILSVDIHRDEAAPHCHVLLLPLIGNRMDGSNMLGGKQKLMAWQKDFYTAVAARYGLSKAPARLAGASKQAAARTVLQRLRETGDKALQSDIWLTLRDKIENDPTSFLTALGMVWQGPKKKLKTMAEIFTSKGKGQAKDSNPIGFAASEQGQTLCSVGFTSKPPPLEVVTAPPEAPAPRPPPQASTTTRTVIETVRVRDSDLDPALYDPTTGEFYKRPPAPERHQRQAADAWVKAALAEKVSD